MLVVKKSLKKLFFIGVLLMVLIAMINTESDITNGRRVLKKRGITEWRFKRLDPNVLNAIETYELELRVKPKRNSEYKDEVKSSFYKIKLVPEDEEEVNEMETIFD